MELEGSVDRAMEPHEIILSGSLDNASREVGRVERGVPTSHP
jgi:hypothetical protein